MSHPFTKGQRVRCIRGALPKRENGVPTGYVETGMEVIIKRTFVGPPAWGSGDGPLPGVDKTPGVELEEFPGDAYTADRFEAL